MEPTANHCKSPLHFRLWLQGHDERQQQRIIDAAAAHLWDPLELGKFVASQSILPIVNLSIVMPRQPWYRNLWDFVTWWAWRRWGLTP